MFHKNIKKVISCSLKKKILKSATIDTGPGIPNPRKGKIPRPVKKGDVKPMQGNFSVWKEKCAEISANNKHFLFFSIATEGLVYVRTLFQRRASRRAGGKRSRSPEFISINSRSYENYAKTVNIMTIIFDSGVRNPGRVIMLTVKL